MDYGVLNNPDYDDDNFISFNHEPVWSDVQYVVRSAVLVCTDLHKQMEKDVGWTA